jgi:prepilin-type N-terminal cleavage/methylation domain-containing protein
MRSQSNSGFTLIEIMVVLVVIGILAAISAPSFMKWLPNIALQSASRDLYGIMQKARSEAVKGNKDWAIVFDTTNNRYYLCSDPGADGDWSGTNDLTGGGDNQISETISLSAYKHGVGFGHLPATKDVVDTNFPNGNISYNDKVAVFNPRGTGLAGYVYLSHKNNTNTYAIGKQISGIIQFRHWKGSAWE